MDARELSDASGVPYSRIYNILTQLEKDKMWIHKEDESRPSRYFCKSPDEALVIAKKQLNDNFDDQSDKIIHELTPIYQAHDTPIKVALYIHRGRNTCISRGLSLINAAKHSIYLVFQEIEFLEIFLEDIKKARARGVVDIKVLIEETIIKDKAMENTLKSYSEISEIKWRNQLFGTCIVMDEGEEAFIIMTQKFFKGLSYFGAQTDHVAFGPAANYYFDYLYKTAELLKLK